MRKYYLTTLNFSLYVFTFNFSILRVFVTNHFFSNQISTVCALFWLNTAKKAYKWIPQWGNYNKSRFYAAILQLILQCAKKVNKVIIKFSNLKNVIKVLFLFKFIYQSHLHHFYKFVNTNHSLEIGMFENSVLCCFCNRL